MKNHENINKTMLVIMNTDESIKRNKNHLRLPSISSILTWHSDLSSTSPSSSSNLPFQNSNFSTTSLSSEYTLPPLLLSNSSSSLLQFNNINNNQQHHQHYPTNYQYNNNNSNIDPFYTSNLSQSSSTFTFKPNLSACSINENQNNNNNNNLQSARKIRRLKRPKILAHASSMTSLSDNLMSQPSTSSLSASIPPFHLDHLNNNSNNNSNNHIIEDTIMTDNDNNDNKNRSVSISSSTSSIISNASNSLIKPRWKDNERLSLLKAIVKEKQLDDMTSFSWDKIALAVGRAKKACKDQWRREVLPALMKSVK